MKKFYVLIMISCAMILLGACQNESLAEKKSSDSNSEMHLSDVYTSPFNEVNKVETVNGATGETTIISDEYEIKNFLSKLEKMELEKIQLEMNEKDICGWLY